MASSIKEQLELLIKLQGIDYQIYSLKAVKEEKPLEYESLRVEFEKKKTSISEAENHLKTLQLKSKEMEIELAQKETNINKLQTQLYQIKTNKEYTAMQKEIEGFKADKSVLEENILEFMDKVEVSKQEVSKQKQVLDSEEKKLQEEKKRIDSEISEIDKKLNDFQQERSQYLHLVEKKLLEKYERILKSKNGLAIVPVKGEACQGCFMNIRPQVLNELHMKETAVVCENCSRLLYVE